MKQTITNMFYFSITILYAIVVYIAILNNQPQVGGWFTIGFIISFLIDIQVIWEWFINE